MRYFRYKNTNKNIENALTEQYKTMTEDEKRTFRKEKRWRNFSMIVTLVIYTVLFNCGIFLLKSIPLPSAWFWETLVIVGEVIVGFILLIACGVLTFALTLSVVDIKYSGSVVCAIATLAAIQEGHRIRTKSKGNTIGKKNVEQII